jgi:pheromone shutdown protein TraB
MARVSGYPTVCDAIIGKRDPVLFERMRGFLEKGPTLALVGASHCPGIGRMLGEAGYAVRTLTGVSP